MYSPALPMNVQLSAAVLATSNVYRSVTDSEFMVSSLRQREEAAFVSLVTPFCEPLDSLNALKASR